MSLPERPAVHALMLPLRAFFLSDHRVGLGQARVLAALTVEYLGNLSMTRDVGSEEVSEIAEAVLAAVA